MAQPTQASSPTTQSEQLIESVPVFDGHNDVLTQLYRQGGVKAAEQLLSTTGFHIDCVKARAGGFAGGFFAMWVSSPDQGEDYQSLMVQESYAIPLPEPVSHSEALEVVMAQAATLIELDRIGAVTICTSADQLAESINHSDSLAAIMHLEGCEAIDTDLHALDVLYAAGLRSLGPVWSRNTVFADGVPFCFPSTPDIGGGLTPDGVALVKRCNQLGIMIDLSHLNLAGFHDVAKHSDAPLVATHSNVHSLCPHARNLTDEQLDIIAQSGGMVGLNFAAAFLRADGRMVPDVPLDQMIRHLDHLMDRLGEHAVGLGSDFDGAEIPEAIGDCSGLPRLIDAMRQHGYGEALIRRLCHENWVDLLGRTWKTPLSGAGS